MPKNKTKDPDAAGPRNFGVFLSQIRHGAFIDELSESLQNVNDQLADVASNHGKAKGSIVVTLSFAHEGESGIVTVTGNLVEKLPKRTGGNSVFWTDKDGNLVNEDPKQLKLALREVAGGAAPPRAVDEKPTATKSL